MTEKQYVIIGNGTAAVATVEGIRSLDRDTPITIVSAERHAAYCRPLISYYLEGKTDFERMRYRPADFYERNGCEVLYGRQAVKLDPERHLISLDDGTELPYLKACVATGSSPFVPKFEGLDTVPHAFRFMTEDDAEALEKAALGESRVLIVGAGLIGLKCAEGLLRRVRGITVCDLADRILPSIFDTECAAMMQAHLESKGIRFLLGDTAVRFDRDKAYMKSGRTVDFDILVLAVGVRANIGLVKDAGGACGRGITVNTHMETALADVYAAGDCTEGMDISFGAPRVLAILPNAYMQGHAAGINMAGGDAEHVKSVPMNSLGLFGLHAVSAGSYFTEADGGELYEEKGEGRLKRLYMKDGYLTGYIMIGDIDRAGIYTSLVRNRVPMSRVDFDLLKKEPALAPFTDSYRRHVLSETV